MTPEQIKEFIAERESQRKWLAERIEQLDREIHDLRCRLVGVKMNNPPGKNGKEPGVEASPHAGPAPQRGDADIAAQAAEIEALRAEVEGWKGQHMRDSAELRRLCQHRDEYKARAERLAEAINAYKSEWDNPVKDYVLRARRRDDMFALLRDQEEGK